MLRESLRSPLRELIRKRERKSASAIALFTHRISPKREGRELRKNDLRDETHVHDAITVLGGLIDSTRGTRGIRRPREATPPTPQIRRTLTRRSARHALPSCAARAALECWSTPVSKVDYLPAAALEELTPLDRVRKQRCESDPPEEACQEPYRRAYRGLTDLLLQLPLRLLKLLVVVPPQPYRRILDHCTRLLLHHYCTDTYI